MNIHGQMESILFVSHKPLRFKVLGKLLNSSVQIIESVLWELQKQYEEKENGFRLVISSDEVQMITAPEHSHLVKEFLKEEMNSELTRPSLETLTIIAYRGPITKAELEQIRGVNCSLILRNLLIRGLIHEEEDKIIMQKRFSISVEFLKHLGIGSVKELPDYQKLSSNDIMDMLLKDGQSSLC